MKESNYSDDSALTDAGPWQSQHQSMELRSAQAAPVCSTSNRPNEVALVQSSGGKPDTNSVMHQYFHAVGAPVGKQVGGVRVGGAKDLDDSGQGGVGACPHVHWHSCQPHRINSDHANHSRSQAAQASLSCIGHFTTILVLARLTSTRMSGADGGVGMGNASSSETGTNAVDWTTRADWQCSRSHRCTMLALTPCLSATPAIDAPAWPHSPSTWSLNSGL